MSFAKNDYGAATDVPALAGVKVAEVRAPPNADEARLNQLGYKQEFKRDMSAAGIITISFTAIGILTGMSSALQTGLFSGGPLGLFWGWNCVSFFMMMIGLSMAEICSAFPTAGGLYYWVCKMRPNEKWLGFYTGNVYLWAMVFTGTSGLLSTGLWLASTLECAGYTFNRTEIAAMAWGFCILAGVINHLGSKSVGRVATFASWWTIGGTVVIVVSLLVKAPTLNKANFVFFDYENNTGWENKGFVVLLGFLQAVYSSEGAETAAQVAEEANNAEWLAPLGIASAVAGSWLVGLIYLLAILFSLQSLPAVEATSFSLPIVQIYYDAAGQKLAIVCCVIVMVAQGAAAMTAWTASSRLFFALARDSAFPGKKIFMARNRYDVPYVGLWLSVLVGCCICACYIGSTIAFNAIISSCAVSCLLAYGMPMLCRVFWPNVLDGQYGPFRLGRFGWSVNLAALVFIILMSMLFIMPASYPVTAENMNYAIVAVGGVVLGVTLQWFFWGKKVYHGVVHTFVADDAEVEAEPAYAVEMADQKV
ncbi:polyamine transporter tpo5 [Cryptotrichosporon argae]